MTLCIAWKDQHGVHLASDSRISLGDSAQTDMAVKVMALPLIIHHPRLEGEKEIEVAYRQTLGMCVVGSFITTYAVKESLQSVLVSLQITPLTDESLLALANFVASFLCTISREVCQTLYKKGEGQIILVGHCRKQERERAFVLSTSSLSYPISVEVKELFQERSIEFFGSGKDKATALYDNHVSSDILKLLKAIAEDKDVPSVGGNLQYGCLENEDFRVFGVRDYDVNHEDRCLQPRLCISGLNLKSDIPQTDGDFVLAYTYKDPFGDEISELIRKGYSICKPS